MKRSPVEQCRRCGRRHEELLQMVDPEGRWAILAVSCGCGHRWTVIQTAPPNLAALRAWMARGCRPEGGPPGPFRSGPWQEYRLEGAYPAGGLNDGSGGQALRLAGR